MRHLTRNFPLSVTKAKHAATGKRWIFESFDPIKRLGLSPRDSLDR
jgi:hypothetical protein